MNCGVWSKRAKLSVVSAFSIVLAACGNGEEATTGKGPEVSGVDDVLEASIPVVGPERRILAFGDSLFAGYGLKDSAGDSYPTKLEAALRAKGVNARITNAAVSGDTTGAGRQRLVFVLDAQKQKPDLFILELGGNDFLRQVKPEEARENFIAIMDELKKREIPVLIMGMRAPPNLGPEYQGAFDAIYPELAETYDAQLIPFWLESIYEDPSLFQGDRIHPTAEGIEALVTATLEPVKAAIPEAEETEGAGS